MEIVIDHLTRMKKGFICAAGLDDEGRHIRPVLAGARLPATLLEANDGPLGIGVRLDIGDPVPRGVRPEVEDHQVQIRKLRAAGRVTQEELWDLLNDSAELTLTDIFGHDLQRRRRGAVVPLGCGRVSLGTYAPGYRPRLAVEDGRLRCLVADPDLGELDLSMTAVDLHCEDDSDWQINQDALDGAKAAIDNAAAVLLSVGLGRPWPESDPAHWLQVNGLHTLTNRERTAEPPSPKPTVAYDVEDIRRTYPNAYKDWTEADEKRLTALFRRGLTTKELTEELGRQPGGIRSRLRRLGLTR